MFDDFKRASAGELIVKFEDNYKYEDRVQFNEE